MRAASPDGASSDEASTAREIAARASDHAASASVKDVVVCISPDAIREARRVSFLGPLSPLGQPGGALSPLRSLSVGPSVRLSAGCENPLAAAAAAA
jgi:hypothetical protein